jgi:uncharacterized cupin superfamily protein
MTKPVINIEELDYQPFPGEMPQSAKEKFGGAKMGQAGRVLGTKKLGYNVTVVPAGKSAFQFHNHQVNEEMFFILEGEGTLRMGKETYPIKKGDFIACLPGGPENAHQIQNTSDAELKYIGVSTKESPEIAEYPDTNKFGVLAETFRFVGRIKDSLGYWDGE